MAGEVGKGNRRPHGAFVARRVVVPDGAARSAGGEFLLLSIRNSCSPTEAATPTVATNFLAALPTAPARI
jgi:hypothetical protein